MKPDALKRTIEHIVVQEMTLLGDTDVQIVLGKKAHRHKALVESGGSVERCFACTAETAKRIAVRVSEYVKSQQEKQNAASPPESR